MSDLTRETISDTLRQITVHQDQTIDSVIKSLESIRESKKISEHNYNVLVNAIRELDILRDVFIVRLMHALKRGDMLNG